MTESQLQRGQAHRQQLARRQDAGAWIRRKSVAQKLSLGITYVALIVLGFTFALPFVWQVSTSLKPIQQVYKFPPEWIPKPFVWRNYIDAMQVVPFGQFFMNTAKVTIFVVIGQVMSCSLAGFAFSRLRWKARWPLFVIMLSTMMLPGQVTLIPQFILFRQLEWVNTLLPITVPYLFAAPYGTFLMRQFFATIPLDMDDAARVDGASTLRIYWQILMPMSKPALATVATFAFNHAWNDYLGPLIYLNSVEKFTLQLGLAAFRSRAAWGGMRWDLLMAATTVVTAPALLVFIFVQRYLIQGVVITGVKG
jgi:multiple sugar transport system permease protein